MPLSCQWEAPALAASEWIRDTSGQIILDGMPSRTTKHSGREYDLPAHQPNNAMVRGLLEHDVCRHVRLSILTSTKGSSISQASVL